MNKLLQDKVKDKCKDMGLSEWYLDGVTERMGGTVDDNSTDEKAIEEVANQIVEIAKLSQGEATRWVGRNKQKNQSTTPKKDELKPEPEPEPKPNTEEKEWEKAIREYQKAMDKRMKELEDQNANLIAERKKQERNATITASFAKHKIPEALREFVSVPDNVEADSIDGYIAGMAQKLVTLQLPNRGGVIQSDNKAITSDQAKSIASKMLPGMGKKENELMSNK